MMQVEANALRGRREAVQSRLAALQAQANDTSQGEVQKKRVAMMRAQQVKLLGVLADKLPRCMANVHTTTRDEFTAIMNHELVSTSATQQCVRVCTTATLLMMGTSCAGEGTSDRPQRSS